MEIFMVYGNLKWSNMIYEKKYVVLYRWKADALVGTIKNVKMKRLFIIALLGFLLVPLGVVSQKKEIVSDIDHLVNNADLVLTSSARGLVSTEMIMDGTGENFFVRNADIQNYVIDDFVLEDGFEQNLNDLNKKIKELEQELSIQKKTRLALYRYIEDLEKQLDESTSVREKPKIVKSNI